MMKSFIVLNLSKRCRRGLNESKLLKLGEMMMENAKVSEDWRGRVCVRERVYRQCS